MSFLEINKNILIKKYPGLYEEISSGDMCSEDASCNDLKIEITPSGDPTLCADGIYVHSKREPLREGQRLAQSAEGCGPVVILGFGLGYSAAAAAASGRPVIIVEKSKKILLKAFECRDFSGFLSDNSLIFLAGNADGIISALDAANEIINAGNGAQDSGKKNSPFVIRNRALISLDEKWYKAADDKIRTWTMRDDVNTATHKKFGRRWVRNLSRNMEFIRDLPGVSRLEGLASQENIPVFLAAAGPSLDKITPLLREIYDRCIIAAVDTSLRFFVKNGIQPDFVLVIDPQFWNCRHLDRCRCESLRTALVAESAVYPPVLSLPFKNKFLCGSLFPFGTFIEKRTDPKGRLGAGGSVATTAWDFARALGAGEIWIAGLDLAFPGLKTHFRGARFEEQASSQSSRFSPAEKWVARALRDGFPFKAQSASGDQVLTDRRLSLYAAWFENQFAKNAQIKSYSFFRDGLAIKGLLAADMEKFLALPKRRGEIDRLITEKFLQTENEFNSVNEKREREKRFNGAVSSLNSGLSEIKNAAEEGAEIARRALRYPLNPAQQNNVLRELDAVTLRITESDVKEVAGFLFPAPDNKEETGISDEDKFRAYLLSSQKLFTGIKDAASQMDLFKNVR